MGRELRPDPVTQLLYIPSHGPPREAVNTGWEERHNQITTHVLQIIYVYHVGVVQTGAADGRLG